MQTACNQNQPVREKKQIQVSKLLSPEALKHETHNSISVTKRRPERNPYPELRSCLPPLWAVPQPKRPGLCVPGFGPPLRLNLRKLLKAQSSADEASGPKLNAWGFPLNIQRTLSQPTLGASYLPNMQQSIAHSSFSLRSVGELRDG